MKPPALSALALGAALGVWPLFAVGAQPDTAPGSPPDGPPPITGQTTMTPNAHPNRGPSPITQIDRPDWSLRQREDRLGVLLDDALADRTLAQPEFDRGKAALAEIEAAEDRLRRVNHGELTDSETFRLEGRLRTLAASIRRVDPPAGDRPH